MENGDDDFTFCKVNEKDGPEANKLTEDMDGISLKSKEEEEEEGSSTDQSRGFLWKGNSVPAKKDIIGSLSFNVIDSSSIKQNLKVSGDAGLVKKPAPARAKVPFEKGYSQVDWLRLTRTHPDLADLKGESNKRLIPMSEVKQHNKEGSVWTVLKGRVYNLTPYMRFHPGGVDILKKAMGRDCTALFNKYHAWVNAEFLLEKCLVGVLDDTQAKK